MPVKVAERWEVNLDRRIGDGGFGAVFFGSDIKEKVPCAAKRVNLSNEEEINAFDHERSILKKVHEHPSVISLMGDAQDEKQEQAWLFLEMATGGELFDRLEQANFKMSEWEVWPYVKGMVNAMQYCHAQGVAHRDLKLENVMLCADEPEAIRLIDFGLACEVRLTETGAIDPTDTRSDTAGTLAYTAPEMNGDAYEPAKADVWALGIITFALSAGFFPLQEASSADWRYAKLKAMIDHMLSIDPAKRFGMEALAADEWLAAEPAGGGGELGERYRSLSGEIGDDADMEPPPEDAPPVTRQAARR